MSITINAKDLDAATLELGLLTGLLSPSSEGSSNYTLNESWFSDPISGLAEGLQKSDSNLPALINELIGSKSGATLNIPAASTDSLGTWYPLLAQDGSEAADTESGPYLVSRPASGGGLTYGLGFQSTQSFEPDLEARIWGILPIIVVDGTPKVALTDPEESILLGVELASTSGPVVEVAGFSLDGLRMSIAMAPAKSGDAAVDVSLEILQLIIPGEDKPSDINLADLDAVSNEEVMGAVRGLLIAALSQILPSDSPEIALLFPAIGFGGTVGDLGDVPAVDWLSLLENSDDVSKPFVNWLQQIASSSEKLQAWGTAVAGLITGSIAQPAGSGTPTDPYQFALKTLGSAGTLYLSLQATTDSNGVTHLVPGLAFDADAIALGTSEAQIVPSITLELVDLGFSGGVLSIAPAPFIAQLSLENKTPGSDLVAATLQGETFSVGSVEMGLELTPSGESVNLLPKFELISVEIAGKSHASLNLLQPEQVLDEVASDVASAVSTEIQKLLGTTAGTPGFAISVLLGFAAPSSDGWTGQLAPPLSPDELANNVTNPLGALQSWYYAVLSADQPLSGALPAQWMAQMVATILSGGAQTISTSSAAGSAQDPWLFALMGDDVKAYLRAYQQDGDLVLGLQVGADFTLGASTALDLSLGADLLTLETSSTSQTLSGASAFSALDFQISLPDAISTPALSGITLSIDSALAQISWSSGAGFNWQLNVNTPQLKDGTTVIATGADLSFAEGQSWADKLSGAGAQTFAPLLAGITGLALLRTGTRAGILLDGWLGLLGANTAQNMPEGLTWPQDMPQLGANVLTEPLQALQTQVNALLSTPEKTKAALSLLGWALSADETAPDITGGTDGQPYVMPLPTSTDIDLALWDNQGSGTGVILGLQRTFTPETLGDVVVSVTASSQLYSSVSSSQAHTPSVTLLADLTGKKGDLVDDVLSSAQIGLTLLLTSDGPTMAPIISVTPTGGGSAITIDFDNPATDLSAAQGETLLTLLNQGVTALVEAYGDNVQLDKFGALLETAGLAVQVDGKFALNAQAWLQLTSAPTEFFTEAGNYLLDQASQREDLVDLIKSVSGLQLPTVPQELLAVLAALGLLTSKEDGYLPIPNTILALFSDPAKVLPAQLSDLMKSEDKRADLAAAFGQAKATATFAGLNLTVLNANDFELSLADPLSFGSTVQFDGSVNFNLTSQALSADLSVTAPQIDSGLVFALQGDDFSTVDFSAAITLGASDGSLQPVQVPLYPFDAGDFLTALEKTVPAMLLGHVVADALTSVLEDHPVAMGVAEAMGLTSTGAGGKTNISLPLQFIDDPGSWLIEKTEMGLEGALSIQGLSRLFSELPAEGTPGSGVYLRTADNSVTVAGLPYSLELVFMADVEANQFSISPRLGEPLKLSNELTVKELIFTLALTPDLVPVPTAQISLQGSVPTTSETFVLNAGYNNGFTLSVSDNKATLNLIPFSGWLEFVKEVAAQAAQKLIAQATTDLLDQLSSSGAADFVSKLRTAAQDLQISELIDDLINQVMPSESTEDGSQPTLEEIAVAWFQQRLSSVNASATAEAVAALLSAELGNVTSKDGLVIYKPDGDGPLTLSFGLDGNIAGLWADMSFDAGAGLQIKLDQTGLGYPIATGGDVQFNLDLSVEAILFGNTGPDISLVWSNSDDFSLTFNPLGKGSAYDRYDAQLLPVPFPGADGTAGGGLDGWLEDLALDVLPRYAVLGLLNASKVKGWLNKPLLDGKIPAPGEILTSINLITEDGGIYMPASPEALEDTTVNGVLAALINAILKDLTADAPLTLVSLPDNGRLQISADTSASESTTPEYTLSLVIPNIALKNSSLALQLGNADAGDWIKQAGKSGTDDYVPGLSVSLSVPEEGPDFDGIRFAAAYIGVSLAGKSGKPLIDLSRLSLESISAQGLLALNFGADPVVESYGAGGDLVGIAFALSPESVTGTNSNPVAHNLLGSSSSTAQGAQPAVNPAFDATLGWISDGTFGASLEQDGKPVSEIYLPIQRSFGPLQVEGIGAQWQSSDKHLDLLFDGGIQTTAITLEVIGLDVGIPVTDPLSFDDYSLDLSGLVLGFKGGTVSLSGDMLKQTSEDGTISYDGEINASTSLLGLTAVGSYALMAADPGDDETQATSLFVFGDVRTGGALGGPPAFSIQGFAGGFSVNRGLTLPDVSDVDTFPLIQAVADPNFISSGSSPAQVLAKFDQVIPPQIGNYWGAAGLNVSSFELVDTFAMLIANFGASFSFDAIGLAKATMPPNVSFDKALAYIELGVTMSFDPSDGEFALTGQLSPSSFILSHDCHLTGGFAVRAWFGDNENAGDFVITLGGYSPAFTPPDYYPSVPRVGFDWRINDDTSITGGTYFALTPGTIMAGADLSAQFHDGSLHAWFDAGADFLISWAPFYYNIDVHVDVGMSYTIDYWIGSTTFSASLGAGLNLYGPQTGGSVYVDWVIISFSIPFGDGGDASNAAVSWDAFATKFLPQNGDDTAPLIAAVEAGQVSGQPAGTVASKTAQFKVTSAIPASTATFSNSSTSFNSMPTIGVKPAAWKEEVDTPLTVTITAADGTTHDTGFTVEPITTGVPSALWSDGTSQAGSSDEDAVIKDAIIGLTIGTTAPQPSGALGPITLSTAYTPTCAQSEDAQLPFATIPQISGNAPEAQDDAFQVLQSTIASEGVEQTRSDITDALNAANIPAIDNPDLSIMREYAEQIMIAPPQLASIGTYVDTPPTASSTPPAIAAPTPVSGSAEMAESSSDNDITLIGAGSLHQLGVRTRAHDGLPECARTRWSWRNLSAHEAKPQQVTVEPGRAFLFQIAKSAGSVRLQLDNPAHTELRVVALDRSGRVLLDRSEATHSVQLPAHSHRVVVLCEADRQSQHPHLEGWMAEQNLLLAGDGRLIGEGCTVFSRGALEQTTRFKSGPNPIEKVIAADLLEHVGGTQIDGTTETCFPNGAATVAVTLNATEIDLKDIRIKLGNRKGGWHTAQPVQMLEQDGATVLFVHGGADEPVRLRTPANGSVHGVFASPLSPQDLQAAWSQQALGTFAHPAHLPSSATTPQLTLLREPR